MDYKSRNRVDGRVFRTDKKPFRNRFGVELEHMVDNDTNKTLDYSAGIGLCLLK